MIESLCRICGALNEARVEYLLVGGFAVAAHGYPRATHDVDLVVALEEENSRRAIRALESIGYTPVAPVPAAQFCDPAIRESWKINKGAIVFQMASANPIDLPVDLFITEPFDFSSEYVAALRLELVAGIEVPVIGLRALIAMKQKAGRVRDIEDVRELQKRSEPSE